MEAFAEIDESPAPLSCVVWNPGADKAKALPDFADEEYKDMVCVEPGLLGHQAILHPGKEARFTQMIFG
jgi:glucose-6-phosphate 1-epimerase